jgi:hypothetical protein
VYDKGKTRSTKFPGDGFIYFSVALVASIIVMALHAPDKWLAAVFCTGVPFLGTITYFRGRRTSEGFWRIMTSAFLLHILLMWVIFGVILRERDDVSLLVCVPGILLECFLLNYAVRRLGGLEKPSGS